MRLLLSIVIVMMAFQAEARAPINGRHTPHIPQRVELQGALINPAPLVGGKETEVIFELNDTYRHKKPLGMDDFLTVHTKRIHLLVIDPTFTDYHHIHPEATEVEGQYRFSFTPRHTDYRMWVDVTPEKTKKQQYVMLNLGSPKAQPPHAVTSITAAKAGGLDFTLATDAPLQTGKASMLSLTIRKNGKTVDALEPIMGAFAHMVGFHEDYQNLMHIHPMGDEPTQASERGKGKLMFHVEPEHAGALHLFVQIIYEGKEMIAPFALNIAAGGKDSEKTHQH